MLIFTDDNLKYASNLFQIVHRKNFKNKISHLRNIYFRKINNATSSQE